MAVELHGDEAMIRVQDNGVGISAEMLAKVFELFVQAAAPSGGSPDGLGIGLALVKTLVAMHGGRVEAASAGPGRGSEFRVYLPILDAQPHSRQHEPLEPAADDATLHAWRILVVDDNALLAESFAELLASEGYMPRIAGSGAAALAAAREFRPEVIFLDIGLPDMNGYELARRLRREPHAQHALLVALSGYAPGSDSNPGDDTLFARYLLKPARIDEVKQLLRDWQRRKPTVAAGSAPAGVSHPAAPEGRRSEA